MDRLPNYITVLTDDLTTSNCYILTAQNHALVIDPNNAAAIQDFLETRHLQLDYIFLTHEHCDHISGLNALRKAVPCTVFAGAACSEGIQNTKRNMSRFMDTYLYFRTHQLPSRPYPAFTCQATDRTFARTAVMTWQTHSFFCRTAPGHTPGSSYFILNNAILFSGDYFIPGEEVITRLPGGDPEAYEREGKAILKTIPTPLLTCPGHGAPFLLTEEIKNDYGL